MKYNKLWQNEMTQKNVNRSVIDCYQLSISSGSLSIGTPDWATS
jgi:hypothetical protein